MSEAGMTHAGMMKLRQLRAGELPGDEAQRIRAHAGECADCRGKLQGLEEEQAGFEAAVSFDRFAAGVERAARPRRSEVARRWIAPAMALAAALVAVVAVTGGPETGSGPGRNTLKGGPEIELKIASPGGQSQRDAPERTAALLSPGERVRIGYRAVQRRYVTVVSIDEAGESTAIYPEAGDSLAVSNGNAMVYLPESLEFTGSGAEKVIVVLSDEPLRVERVAEAARAAFASAGGDLSRMGPLPLPGSAEQLARTVQKP